MNTLFPSLEKRAKTNPRLGRQPSGNPIHVFAMLLIAVPVYIVVTVPLVLIGLVHRFVVFTCFSRKRQRNDDLSTDETRTITNKAQPFPKLERRTYDVVVMGATGLTGSALAQYFAAYHPNLKVALAGRSEARVKTVKDSLGAAGAHFGVIVANSSDLESLFEMCRSTRVVATTVGPFKRFGSKLVHACAHSGTHYADITGEPDWVDHMAKLYNDVAKKTGAAIVSCCGVDSVPSDVGSFLAIDGLREEHGQRTVVTHIEAIMTKFSGGMPAGSMETVAGMFDGTDVLQSAPLDFTASDMVRLGSTKIVGQNAPLRSSSVFKQWTIPFFMAPANSTTVRRTNNYLGYSSNLTYTERWGFPDFSSAFMTLSGMIMGTPYLGLPFLRQIARSVGALPKANAGAKAVTVESCVRGSCCMLVCATGRTETGDVVTKKLRFAGLGDVGVAFTAVCHGEISVLLAQRKTGPKALVGAGMSPVAALGKPLADTLVKTGFIFVDDVPDTLLK